MNNLKMQGQRYMGIEKQKMIGFGGLLLPKGIIKEAEKPNGSLTSL